jgi:teichuronic acid biosynthesis glycosyltransferase TuaH
VVVAVVEATRVLSRDGHVPQPWDGLVVLCAANDYDGVKLADQHLAEQLARLVPVLYVDPPLSRLTAARSPQAAQALREPALRVLAPGLARLTPVVQPFPSRRGMTGLTSALTGRHLSRAARQLGGQVSAIISAWPQYPVFRSCAARTRVYWAQDDFVSGAQLMGLNPGVLDARERRVAAAANLIIAANPVVADTWRDRGQDPVLIPFGVDATAYASVDEAAPPTDVDLPGPVAGFVGHINDRIDMRLLEAVADRGRSILLVGPASFLAPSPAFDALVTRPNVRWVGKQPFSALPGYLRLMDVGLVPYGDSPFNRGSFPLKTLEYLAAGRPVVATDLPATRWLATDLVTIESQPRLFADQVDRRLDEVRTPTAMAARREFAARHSWAHRAAAFRDAIAEVGTAT